MDEAFGALRAKRLNRVMNLWKDETRIQIDGKVLKILGIDADLDALMRRLCREPAIHGESKLDLALAVDA